LKLPTSEYDKLSLSSMKRKANPTCGLEAMKCNLNQLAKCHACYYLLRVEVLGPISYFHISFISESSVKLGESKHRIEKDWKSMESFGNLKPIYI